MSATPDRGAAVKAFLRTAAPAALLLGFFIISVSGDVYDVTSPPQFTYHVLLRKLYALAAFTLTGAAVVPWFSPRYRPLKTALAITIFSAAIEIAQRFAGSHESWRWNAFDILSGALGGFIGGLLWDWAACRFMAPFRQQQPIESRRARPPGASLLRWPDRR